MKATEEDQVDAAVPADDATEEVIDPAAKPSEEESTEQKDEDKPKK